MSRFAEFTDRELEKLESWAESDGVCAGGDVLWAELNAEIRARKIEKEALAAADAVRARYAMLDEVKQNDVDSGEWLAQRVRFREAHDLTTEDEFVRKIGDQIARVFA